MTKGILDEIFDLPGWEDEESSVLKEAPGDDEPTGGDDAPADDAGNDANADNNAEDAPQEDQGEDNQDNDDQQDNFDIDTDNTDDGEGEAPEGEDQDNQTADGGAGGADGTDDDAPSEEMQSKKDEYDQLYKELTPEEIAYRNMVLKNEYKDLHTICGSILTQTGYFPNVAVTQDLVKRLIKSLQNFRKYIAFYLTDIYDTKSYYENKFQYEVYLQIFNGIKSVFQDLEKMMSHIDEEQSKDKK